MGSCVSLRRGPDSTVKPNLSFRSKTDELSIPSPVKDAGNDSIVESALKSLFSTTSAQPLNDSSSQGERFFDSKPWLESDCDDDFLSVNGEFTPSRGTTPLHHFTPKTTEPQPQTSINSLSAAASPSSNEKKILAELFRDSSRGYIDVDGIFSGQSDGEKDSLGAGSPSPDSSSKPLDRESKVVKDKPAARRSSARGCLPRLSSSWNYGEERRRRKRQVSLTAVDYL